MSYVVVGTGASGGRLYLHEVDFVGASWIDWSGGAAVFARAGEAHREMLRAEDGRPVFVRGLVGTVRAAHVARAQ